MKNSNTTKTNTEFYVQLGIIAILALVIVFNIGRIYSGSGNEIATGVESVSASNIIPKGIPTVYGAEMNIKYDDVSVNKPLSKFGLKIFLGNLGLKKEDIQKIIRDNF